MFFTAHYAMLQTVEPVSNVSPTNVDFVGGHSDDRVDVEEKIMKNVEDGCLRVDQFLQIFRVEISPVSVDG